jgi:hypothetical protein
MATTYRTDWMDPTDPHQNRVDVSHHGADLGAAQRVARKMSKAKAIGSAYVIKAVDGQDVAQLGYTDGRACPHGWDAG